ncbi:hypothetical protein JHK85_000147 [Glycine max]|nr:hypothetical protein JHK85_000147 [Glycine max]
MINTRQKAGDFHSLLKDVIGLIGSHFPVCIDFIPRTRMSELFLWDGSCELFPREMVESWEEQINNHQAVGQLQAELFPQHGLACLNCRQFNAKLTADLANNNQLGLANSIQICEGLREEP